MGRLAPGRAKRRIRRGHGLERQLLLVRSGDRRRIDVVRKKNLL
jgi:hypothetical protein